MKSSQKSACSPVVVKARLEEERHGMKVNRTSSLEYMLTGAYDLGFPIKTYMYLNHTRTSV